MRKRRHHFVREYYLGATTITKARSRPSLRRLVQRESSLPVSFRNLTIRTTLVRLRLSLTPKRAARSATWRARLRGLTNSGW
jgi:hypothetical protein